MNAAKSALVTAHRSIQKSSTVTLCAGRSSGQCTSDPIRKVPPTICAMPLGIPVRIQASSSGLDSDHISGSVEDVLMDRYEGASGFRVMGVTPAVCKKNVR